MSNPNDKIRADIISTYEDADREDRQQPYMKLLAIVAKRVGVKVSTVKQVVEQQ